MPNPYLRGDGRPELLRSWLAFLDVLGFKEILREDDRSQIEQLHHLLRQGSNILQGAENDDLATEGFQLPDYHALTAFTDNIVLGFPIHDDGEMESGMAFDRIGEFQLHMVLGGFFVRGGLAFGDAYVDDLAVYGPALLQAYEAESQLARDPRIVISQSGKEVIAHHLEYYGRMPHAPQNTDLKRDRDGQWFIDYLESTIIDPHPEEQLIDFEKVMAHRDIVTAKLSEYSANPRVWSKYEWVADYHNDFCARYPKYFDRDFLIDVEAARASISSILTDVD
ncbi:hypothetical protein [Ruegeria atlantica]|uniref:Uncharacterized protein n=1 Tax=Ruegeria atlantica TaxID=81569 RepID=A0A0P1E8L6_9RHOB|nr:hypothetical protein [Ruegeria atlantica]CUH45455.1 hypothetical protein RUM4293_04370 [Ruegeria atlantica]